MKARRNLIQIWLLCAAMLQTLNSGAQSVTQIVAGGGHSLFLKSDGSLWGMGLNGVGQLGDGTYGMDPYFATNLPEQIVASNIMEIAAGNSHSLFLKSDGSLLAMGWNEYGQLGDGTSGLLDKTNIPEQIVASNVTAIATGYAHSLFLKNNGSLWGMGYNWAGQLGDGTYNNTNLPEEIVASNVVAIAVGYGHSLFLKNDGSLWAMGLNWYGQLGDCTDNNSTNLPEEIVTSNVTAIAAGGYHSLFLKNDESLWVMGDNEYGQLGDGNEPHPYGTNQPEQIVASNVTTIAAGLYHSLFLKSDGSLWAMGFNHFGQLGSGNGYTTNQPEQIVAGGVTAIAAGDSYSLFVKSDGSLWGMGDNSYGQLGNGTYDGTNQPEQILAAYNQISGQLLSGGKMQLSFVGIANSNYALDRSASLSPTNWIPQVTNAAGSFGALVFTDTPDATTNNFWRIRSVP